VRDNVHDGVQGVLDFLRVEVRGIILGEYGAKLLELGDGNLTLY